jgi:hypothetical protein
MNYRSALAILFPLLIVTAGYSQGQKKTGFAFSKNEEGINLTENGKPVFFYQQKTKLLDGRYNVNNYLHPLYSLNGNILTEVSPKDHPYHSGIFWRWHQHYVGNKSIGEGWVFDGIYQEVENVSTKLVKGTAQFDISVLYKSSNYENGKPYIREKTKIIVYPSEKNYRSIDFEIALQGLVPDAKIGGAADEKGYGGFCPRIMLPDGMVFTSTGGQVKPQNTQIVAGPWMDMSGALEKNGEISGVTMMCHPTTPNYPAPWILRQKTSMQNVVYPGRELVTIQMDKPVVLRYRLLIHNGDAASLDLNAVQKEYEKLYRK